MTIQELITYCVEVGGLTLTDLSRLLEKPRCTVYTWHCGRDPRGYHKWVVLRRLLILKDQIDTGGKIMRFPIGEQDRKLKVMSLKNELFGFSEEGATR